MRTTVDAKAASPCRLAWSGGLWWTAVDPEILLSGWPRFGSRPLATARSARSAVLPN